MSNKVGKTPETMQGKIILQELKNGSYHRCYAYTHLNNFISIITISQIYLVDFFYFLLCYWMHQLVLIFCFGGFIQFPIHIRSFRVQQSRFYLLFSGLEGKCFPCLITVVASSTTCGTEVVRVGVHVSFLLIEKSCSPATTGYDVSYGIITSGLDFVKVHFSHL